MSTIFTKIINREIPAQFVYEDEHCAVLMDKFPAVAGQVLVIPKEEVDYLFDVPTETYQHLCAVAKKVAKALDTVFETERTCVVVEGFEVPHAHIKLYPMTSADTNLGAVITQTKEMDDETLQTQADKLKAALT
jgi:histidine triad (HIT) family protein